MGERVLIVEDEAKLAGLLRDYLVQDGFEASVLHRGDEVEPWVSTHDVDLVLLDLMLPGKNGLEVCKALRASSGVADHHGHRPRRGDRPAAGPRAGRRRLHLQALQPPRGRRAREGGPAPGEARRAPRGGRCEARRGGVSRDDRRQGPQPHGGGVPAVQGAGRSPGPDLYPRAAHGRDVPRPAGRRRPDRRQPHQEDPPEDSTSTARSCRSK